MLVSKSLLSTIATASKDGTRPLLTCIRVYKEDDKIVSVATDGYILSEVIENTPNPDEFPMLPNSVQSDVKDAVLIPAETAKKMIGAMKKSETLPILNYAKVTPETITTTDLEQTTVLHFRSPEGNYPEYRQLTDLTEEKAKTYKTVSVNPKYLKQVMALFKDDTHVELSVSDDKLSPVYIRSESNGVKKMAVIMPLRG